jgi:hypothetical protein
MPPPMATGHPRHRPHVTYIVRLAERASPFSHVSGGVQAEAERKCAAAEERAAGADEVRATNQRLVEEAAHLAERVAAAEAAQAAAAVAETAATAAAGEAEGEAERAAARAAAAEARVVEAAEEWAAETAALRARLSAAEEAAQAHASDQAAAAAAIRKAEAAVTQVSPPGGLALAAICSHLSAQGQHFIASALFTPPFLFPIIPRLSHLDRVNPQSGKRDPRPL